eukprot:NODE_252_length_2386_cov_22.255456_g198_i0.p1 GENE.NODE_252_length_2386_cov_22.255456_g198_i0~~NODE_252_length_2386_cov_22.255456_g198_i0.p1  ORF type:complete len:762 (-),score=291.76 NODE_252_length_2386_cov_22.255456_g198_i0:101-2158(-)
MNDVNARTLAEPEDTAIVKFKDPDGGYVFDKVPSVHAFFEKRADKQRQTLEQTADSPYYTTRQSVAAEVPEPKAEPPPLSLLPFNIPEDIMPRLLQALVDFKDKAKALNYSAHFYDLHGRRLMRNFQGLEAFWPIAAANLAYFRLHQSVPNIRDEVQGNHFKNGRSHVVRPQSHQLAFMGRIWTHPTGTKPLAAQTYKESYQRAENIHTMRTNLAQEYGVSTDLHLKALEHLCFKDNAETGAAVPRLFAHPAWHRLKKDHLRIQRVPQTDYYEEKPFMFGGVGPREHEEYTVGVWNDQHRQTFSVMSFHNPTESFKEEIDRALYEMVNMNHYYLPTNFWRECTYECFWPEGRNTALMPKKEEDFFGYWAFHNLPRRVQLHSVYRTKLTIIIADQERQLLRNSGCLDFSWKGLKEEHDGLCAAGKEKELQYRWERFLKTWFPVVKLQEFVNSNGIHVNKDMMSTIQKKLFEVFILDYKLSLLMSEVDARVHPTYPELGNLDIQAIYERGTMDILEAYKPAANLRVFNQELNQMFTVEEITALDWLDQKSDALWAQIHRDTKTILQGEDPEEALGLWSVFGAGKDDSTTDLFKLLHFSDALKKRSDLRLEAVEQYVQQEDQRTRLEEQREAVKAHISPDNEYVREAKKLQIESMMSEMKESRQSIYEAYRAQKAAEKQKKEANSEDS